MQTNAVERTHADAECRILLACLVKPSLRTNLVRFHLHSDEIILSKLAVNMLRLFTRCIWNTTKRWHSVLDFAYGQGDGRHLPLLRFLWLEVKWAARVCTGYLTYIYMICWMLNFTLFVDQTYRWKRCFRREPGFEFEGCYKIQSEKK